MIWITYSYMPISGNSSSIWLNSDLFYVRYRTEDLITLHYWSCSVLIIWTNQSLKTLQRFISFLSLPLKHDLLSVFISIRDWRGFNYILFNITLESIFHSHWDVTIIGEGLDFFLPLLCAYGVWIVRDLYRATRASVFAVSF